MSLEETPSPSPPPVPLDFDEEKWREWLQKYDETSEIGLNERSKIISCLKYDEIDRSGIEKTVQDLALGIRIERGFCPDCNHLFTHWPVLSEDRVHGIAAADYPIIQIEAAAKAGCKFCRLLYSRLWYTQQLDTYRRIERRFKLLGDPRTTTLNITRLVPWVQFIWLNYPGKIANFNDTRTGPLRSQLISYTANPNTIISLEMRDVAEQAKIWLTFCNDNHKDCSLEPENDSKLPSRLIQLTDDAVHLIESAKVFADDNGSSRPPKYATLSYIWGQKKFLTLTRDNLATFMVDIPVQALAKTFQDAIDMTRKLGLSYI